MIVPWTCSFMLVGLEVSGRVTCMEEEKEETLRDMMEFPSGEWNGVSDQLLPFLPASLPPWHHFHQPWKHSNSVV